MKNLLFFIIIKMVFIIINFNIKFSFIIIGKDKDECLAALNSLQGLEGDHTYEVLLATGKSPSLQRNEASLSAIGEFLIFLEKMIVMLFRI